MHVEGLGETNKTSGGDTGEIKLDETLRRFKGGWFIDMEGAGQKMNERTTAAATHKRSNTKRKYTERESNPCRLLGRQA